MSWLILGLESYGLDHGETNCTLGTCNLLIRKRAVQTAHDQYEKGELEKAKDGFNYVPMLFLSNIILLRSSWARKLMIVGKFRPQLIELTSFKPKLLIIFIMNKTC